MIVDAEGARTQCAGHLVALLDVGGPDAAGQAEGGIVGDAQRVVVVLVLDDAQHGTEDLLLRDPHRVVDVPEHGLVDEPALVEAFGDTATECDLGALFLADLDVALHALLLGLVGHGADDRFGVGRQAEGQLVDGGDEGVDNFLVPVGRGENPARGVAGLTGDEEHLAEETLDRVVEVGVVADDGGGLAAEFQGDRTHQRGTCLADRPAHLDAAGERDLVDIGVRHQILAGLHASGDHVEHAARNAGGLEGLGEADVIEARLRGRLDHYRAAGQQCWGVLHHSADLRPVPWRNGADHAVRCLLNHHVEALVHGVVRGPAHLPLVGVDVLRVVAQQFRGDRHLPELGLGDRRTHLGDHGVGHLVGALVEFVGDASEYVGPLAVRHPRPRT